MGFDRTVVFDDQLAFIGHLSEDTHRELWQQKVRPVGDREFRVIADPDAHDVNAWEARLAAGDFHSSRVIPEFLTAHRAMPCPCGSGKWFKHCHGRLPSANGATSRSNAYPTISAAYTKRGSQAS
jgi:hypothetical protein